MISDDEREEPAETTQKKRSKGSRNAAEEESKTENGIPLSKRMLEDFNNAMNQDEAILTDANQFAVQKVAAFIERNPLNQVFIKREKARLPYSVFKPHAHEVFFLKSIFAHRPPTAFFPYPNYVHMERNSDRVRRYSRDEIEYLFMSFKISDTTHIYNAVVNTCKNAGFNMVEGANTYFNV